MEVWKLPIVELTGGMCRGVGRPSWSPPGPYLQSLPAQGQQAPRQEQALLGTTPKHTV